MKLTQALKLIQAETSTDSPYRILLACGFSPLHLQTYTHAFLQQRLTGRKVAVETGLFGDLPGTLRRALENLESGPGVHAAAVVIEWADLDARLGYRSLGGWGPRQEPDIVNEVRRSLGVLGPLLSALAARVPVALSLPTLRLPPVFHTTGWQASASETAIDAQVMTFAKEVTATSDSCFLVNRDRLATVSPLEARLDLKSELYYGFPYTLEHASHVAEAMAQLLAPAAPFKGLITDLDDTFWGGIVGEIGESGVAWDLASHKQLHGIYQQMLEALADQGVLIAVASRNDPATARRGLEREDVVMPASKIFPLEVHWQAKSASIGRIVEAWNIGADAVVFIDDSPMELAEVKAAHPAVECIAFPKDSYQTAEAFLRNLRDRFGKPRLNAEDELRRESLRQGAVWRETVADAAPSDGFLATLDATISIATNAATDPRALELVNKTNQFNLNGRRYDAGSWSAAAKREGAFVWTISYHDKFGPLGKIAVAAGRSRGSRISVDTWVMSCRAFARRIEHQTLRQLFELLQADEIELDYVRTDRNGPSTELLLAITGGPPQGSVTLTRQAFGAACPELMHQVKIVK